MAKVTGYQSAYSPIIEIDGEKKNYAQVIDLLLNSLEDLENRSSGGLVESTAIAISGNGIPVIGSFDPAGLYLVEYSNLSADLDLSNVLDLTGITDGAIVRIRKTDDNPYRIIWTDGITSAAIEEQGAFITFYVDQSSGSLQIISYSSSLVQSVGEAWDTNDF